VTTEWQEASTPAIISWLPKSEANRQTTIRNVISREQQYIKGLDLVEEVFIRPLRNADPPIIRDGVDEFIEEVFGNILDLRKCNRHLLDTMLVRQREQGDIISSIGDIFLDAATEFRLPYLTYIVQMPEAEKRLKDEMEKNGKFAAFLENNVHRMGLQHWLNRPSEHLQKYPVLFEDIRTETAEGNPDVDFLKEAVEAMRNLQDIAQLRGFQTAMGKGPTGKFRWQSLVPEGVRNGIEKREAKRQA